VRGEVRIERSDEETRDQNTFSSPPASAVDQPLLAASRLHIDAVVSDTESWETSFAGTDYVEASLGYAYGPVDNERLNALSSGQASELSLDEVLQHLTIERQVRHDLLQPDILLFKLAQPLHLRRHHAGLLLLPIGVGRPAIPVFRQISATLIPSSPCLMMNAF